MNRYIVALFSLVVLAMIGSACPSSPDVVIEPPPKSKDGVCRLRIDLCDVDATTCAQQPYAQYCEIGGDDSACSFKTPDPNPCLGIKEEDSCGQYVANSVRLCDWHPSN